MEINRNAEVYIKNEKKAGSIERVVIDPKTKEITHVVVDKGFLFSDDRMVPVTLIEKATENRIDLKVDEDELDELQEFEETFHIPAKQVDRILHEGHTRRVRSYVAYPPYDANWWIRGGYPLPPYVTHTVRFIPEGTVALKEGAKVVTSDDESIGKVESLLTEPSENRVTHMVVSQGFISEKKILIPSIWISMVMEDEIHLVVDSGLTESLPEYETEKL